MRLHKARRSYGCEINIAPLIDIVFLLIIFFMIVSQITRVEVENLELPEAKKGEDPKPVRPSHFVINVQKDGRVAMFGQALSIASLQGLLAEQVRGRQPDEISVVVRGDRTAPWRAVAGILRACAANRISRVRVAVIEPESGGPSP